MQKIERRAHMDNIQTFIKESDDFKSIVNGLHEGLKEQLLAGLSGSARSVLPPPLHRKRKGRFSLSPIIYIRPKSDGRSDGASRGSICFYTP